MSTQNKAPEYMLLFRGNDWAKELSPEEMQRIAGEWMNWFERLLAQGKVIAGSPLEPQGKTISGSNGRVVADGPFAESKEAVGGYFLLRVNTLDEAIAIARQCPGLNYGVKIEVRPVAEKCPLTGAAVPERELAQAAALSPPGASRPGDSSCGFRAAVLRRIRSGKEYMNAIQTPPVKSGAREFAHLPRLRGHARAGVRSVDRPQAPGAVVGATHRHQSGL